MALKSYIMSPFVDHENLEIIVEKVLEARGQLRKDTASRKDRKILQWFAS